MSALDYWIIFGIIFLIIEIITIPLEFLFASIGLACLLTALAAFLAVESLKLQLILFTVFSLIIFLALKPITKKYLYTKKELKTNIDNYTGQTAKVIQEINNEKEIGRVSLYGEEWNARSTDNTTIEADTIVIIEKIENMILFVRKK